MIVAAGFTLLKLLNSIFARHIDIEYGKTLFNRTIWAIRAISVATNDLPSRLAEVLAQLWRGGGAGSRTLPSGNDISDSSLQLKVRCRMSMSLVYDSIWRWREEFQAKGRGNLECKHYLPTQLALIESEPIPQPPLRTLQTLTLLSKAQLAQLRTIALLLRTCLEIQSLRMRVTVLENLTMKYSTGCWMVYWTSGPIIFQKSKVWLRMVLGSARSSSPKINRGN